MIEPHYIGPSTVGRALGVVRATVSNWVQRHGDTIPMPDAHVDGGPVWLESRLPEWNRWYMDRKRIVDEVPVHRLRELAQHWADHHEYNEADDPANDTGAENDAYHACGSMLHDLLDELTGVPRCKRCGQYIIVHEATGLWIARGDITPGVCYQNLRPGLNEASNGRHIPRQTQNQHSRRTA